MGIKVRAEKVHEDYLENLAKSSNFRIGFLLGGQLNQDDYSAVIVHMAPLEVDEECENCETILDVDPEEIVLRAINLVRMLPGGFTVLGLFLVNAQNVLTKEDQKKKLKDIVGRIQEEFRQNQHLKALQTDEKDFLVLTYTSGSSSCHQIHTGKQVTFEFSPRKLQWRKVEVVFEVDEELPLENEGESCNVAANLRKILGKITKKIEEAKEMNSGEPIDPEAKIDDITEDQTQNLLFRPDDDLADDVFQVEGELVRLSGVINSRVFTPAGVKLAEVMKNLKRDIIRSLEARLQLYCDTLTEENVPKGNLINLQGDAPRRVFFTVQPTGVQFSDYLFSDENDDTVRENVSKMMDINLEPTDIYLLAEQPDDEELTEICSDSTEMLNVVHEELTLKNYFYSPTEGINWIFFMSFGTSLVGALMCLAAYLYEPGRKTQ